MPNISSFRGASRVAYHLQSQVKCNKSWNLRWKPICASTEIDLSRWLFSQPLITGQLRAVISARQNHGKGQYKRIWNSSKGGVWMSAAFPGDEFLSKSTELFGLSIAVALAERIEKKGEKLKIKWPNDLMARDRKLGGILPRLVFRGNNLRLARVGIGLNVDNRVPLGAISLAELFGRCFVSNNKWAAEVLLALENAMNLCSNEKYLCDEVERRLWAEKIIDNKTGLNWNIEGISIKGGLKLSRAKEKKTLYRWS